jgi:hypothetical protein
MVVFAITTYNFLSIPFLSLFVFGYYWAGFSTLYQEHQSRLQWLKQRKLELRGPGVGILESLDNFSVAHRDGIVPWAAASGLCDQDGLARRRFRSRIISSTALGSRYPGCLWARRPAKWPGG